jgi:hypothetical protein
MLLIILILLLLFGGGGGYYAFGPRGGIGIGGIVLIILVVMILTGRLWTIVTELACVAIGGLCRSRIFRYRWQRQL